MRQVDRGHYVDRGIPHAYIYQVHCTAPPHPTPLYTCSLLPTASCGMPRGVPCALSACGLPCALPPWWRHFSQHEQRFAVARFRAGRPCWVAVQPAAARVHLETARAAMPALLANAPGLQDAPLPIGYHETISAPHMHATCLELLREHLRPGARVLDVGSGGVRW